MSTWVSHDIVDLSHVATTLDLATWSTLYGSLYTSLIGGWAYPSEKYELVSWDDDIPNIWKNKSCSKPPTRYSIHVILPFDLSLSVKHSINAERHNIKRWPNLSHPQGLSKNMGWIIWHIPIHHFMPLLVRNLIWTGLFWGAYCQPIFHRQHDGTKFCWCSESIMIAPGETTWN